MVENKDDALVSNEEIHKFMHDISSSKRIMILEYMGKLKHVDTSIVYYLIELLAFN